MTSPIKSNYYQVRLRELTNDDGSNPKNRELLKVKSASAADPLYNYDGLPLSSQQTIANESIPTESTQRNLMNEVIFDVSPTVSESRSVNYADRAIQGPSGVVVYETTGNKRFSISARFVSRNYTEATLNFYATKLLRSWLIPQSLNGFGGRPPILRLNGYKNQFFNIPTVITSLNFSFPEDVDYIETDFAMVPIVQTVELELLEAHSSVVFNDFSGVSDPPVDEFNLGTFKAGILPGY